MHARSRRPVPRHLAHWLQHAWSRHARLPPAPPTCALLTFVLAVGANPALSAPPSAAQILQEPRAPLSLPATSAPPLLIDKPAADSVTEGGARIKLTRIRFSGNTAFSA